MTPTNQRVEPSTSGAPPSTNAAIHGKHNTFPCPTLQTPDRELQADMPVEKRRTQRLAKELVD